MTFDAKDAYTAEMSVTVDKEATDALAQKKKEEQEKAAAPQQQDSSTNNSSTENDKRLFE